MYMLPVIMHYKNIRQSMTKPKLVKQKRNEKADKNLLHRYALLFKCNTFLTFAMKFCIV